MHLGCAGQRAGGESGLEHVHVRHAVVQHALDVAHDVHHVAVALDHEGLGHLDRADLRDATDVVARQVDQHHVLGALLRVGQQFDLGRLVLLGRGTARTGAGQRADDDFLAFFRVLLAHQDFGRGPHHMEIPEVVVVHVGTGIERTQRAVQRQGRLGVALADALADLHLHEITRGDQFLGALDRFQVVVLGEAALGRVALAGFDHRCRYRVLERLFQLAQALLGIRVGLGLGRVGVDDQVELAREVVDDRQFLALQQQDVGRAQGIGRAAVLQLLLDVAHRVVAEVARQATAETRQAGPQGDLEALLIGGDEVQRVAVMGFDDLAVAHNLGLGGGTESAGAQQRAGGQADEAVAAETLAADHGLQQEAVGAIAPAMGQLEVKGQRGLKVREGLGHQRDAVVALLRETLEFQFGDHATFLRRTGARLRARRRPCSGKSAPAGLTSVGFAAIGEGRSGTRRGMGCLRWLAPGPGSPAKAARHVTGREHAGCEHDGHSVAKLTFGATKARPSGVIPDRAVLIRLTCLFTIRF